MEVPVPIYILHTELPDQRGKLTGLNLCELIDELVPGQVMGSQHINGIWSIWIKSKTALVRLEEIKTVIYDNIQIEMHIRYPNTKPTPNEKIVFKDLPPWVSDQEILTYLRKQPGIIVKSGVISARFRDTQNKLTPFFSGDRFVFVKGNLTQALHTTVITRV